MGQFSYRAYILIQEGDLPFLYWERRNNKKIPIHRMTVLTNLLDKILAILVIYT